MTLFIFLLVAMLSLLVAEIIRNRRKNAHKQAIIDEELYGGLKVVSINKIGEDNCITEYVLIDPETRVMYTYLVRYGNSGGITVLYNADGTPKIFS